MLIDKFDAFFFDLDGVIFVGDRPTPGAVKLISTLRAENKPVRFLTNNPCFTREHFAEKLQRMGIAVSFSEFFSAGYVVAKWLAKRFPQGTPVYIVGNSDLKEEFTHLGFNVTTTEQPQAVVIGSDYTVSYGDIRDAARFIRRGAAFIAACLDNVYPTPEGLAPSTGPFVRAVEMASEVKPEVIGKPALPMFLLAKESVPQGLRIAMVGDNPRTDVSGAKNAGLTGIWLHRTDGEVITTPASVTPDYVINSLEDLFTDIKPQPGRDIVKPEAVHPLTAAVVLDSANRVLLSKNEDGSWGLPTGELEPGKTVHDIVASSLEKGTHLTMRAQKLIGVYSDPDEFITHGPDGNSVQLFVTAFLCAVKNPDAETLGGKAESRFFSLDTLPETFPSMYRKVLDDALAERFGVIS